MKIETKFGLDDKVYIAICNYRSGTWFMDPKPYIVRRIDATMITDLVIRYAVSPPNYGACSPTHIDESSIFSSLEEGNKAIQKLTAPSSSPSSSQGASSLDKKFKRRWVGNCWKDEQIS